MIQCPAPVYPQKTTLLRCSCQRKACSVLLVLLSRTSGLQWQAYSGVFKCHPFRFKRHCMRSPDSFSHFKWIGDPFTSKWNWPFRYLEHRSVLYLYLTSFFFFKFWKITHADEAKGKCFCFWADQINFVLLCSQEIKLALAGHLISCNSSKGLEWEH